MATISACSSRSAAPAPPVVSQPDRPAPPRPPDPSAGRQVPPVTQPAGAVDQCALIPERGEPIATVALSERVDASNAPRPSNDSERLLFRQVYETLVRIDCLGRVAPGLAAAWRLDDDRRTWVVTLREARFADGTPVTAAAVRASWGGGTVDQLRRSASRLIESITPLSDRMLAIRLRSSRTDAPVPLAHPDLAVAMPVAGSAWPAGTRPARLMSEAGGSAITVTRDGQPPLRFAVATGDPRDVLDRGAELLLTRDPATLRYAASLPQYHAVPLEWQRTYVLLAPGRSRTAPALGENARGVLAGDAVRGEARGAMGPFWWQELPDCEIGRLPPAQQSSPTPRVVYEAGDDAARDLAERLVGLVRAAGPGAAMFLEALLPDRPRRTYQRATGLGGDALAVSRRRGTDAGHIVAVASRPIDPCREMQALMDMTPWLDPETIVPLVETRLHAIVRRGRSGISAESDGGLIISSVNGAP